MADILDETHDEIKKISPWIGAETVNLQALEKLLLKLRSSPGDYKKVKLEIRDRANNIGRSEYRSKRGEIKIEENLRKLAEEVPEAQKKKILDVAEEFEIAEKKLIDESSRYTGEIKGKVEKVGIQAELLLKRAGNEAMFKVAVEEAIREAHQAFVWTAGLLAVLKKADHIIASLKAYAR
jgi:hypothetical protein